jgi:hypothetical protein
MKDLLLGLWERLDGHKTNVLGVLGLALWLGWVAGWWTMDQVKELAGLLSLLGVLSMRDAIKKSEV